MSFAGQTSMQIPQPVQSSGDDLDRHQHPGQVLRAPVLRAEPVGRAGERLGLVHLHPDRGVRADERALRAVDADRLVPDRQLVGEVALLECDGADGERAVDGKRADRKPVAVAADQRPQEIRRRGVELDVPVDGSSQSGHVDLVEGVEGEVDGLEVPLDDLLAALRVRLRDRLLDRADRALARQHVGEREEARLEDRVRRVPGSPASRATFFASTTYSRRLLAEDPSWIVARQLVPDVVGAVRAVEQEGRAVLGDAEHVHPRRAGRSCGTRRTARARSGTRSGSAAGRSAGARSVVEPDFFESKTKYACVSSGVDSPMIFAEFLFAPTVPSEPSP